MVEALVEPNQNYICIGVVAGCLSPVFETKKFHQNMPKRSSPDTRKQKNRPLPLEAVMIVGLLIGSAYVAVYGLGDAVVILHICVQALCDCQTPCARHVQLVHTSRTQVHQAQGTIS